MLLKRSALIAGTRTANLAVFTVNWLGGAGKMRRRTSRVRWASGGHVRHYGVDVAKSAQLERVARVRG